MARLISTNFDNNSVFRPTPPPFASDFIRLILPTWWALGKPETAVLSEDTEAALKHSEKKAFIEKAGTTLVRPGLKTWAMGSREPLRAVGTIISPGSLAEAF
jgi:hypothetical protein